MRSPPAVGVHVASKGPWVWAGLLVPSLTAGVVADALLEHWGSPASLTMAGLVGCLGLLLGYRWWIRSEAEWNLIWTGRAWTLNGGGAAPQQGLCAVLFDLGDWVLLRWQAKPGAATERRWLAISRKSAGPAWREFRVALRWALAAESANDESGHFNP